MSSTYHFAHGERVFFKPSSRDNYYLSGEIAVFTTNSSSSSSSSPQENENDKLNVKVRTVNIMVMNAERITERVFSVNPSDILSQSSFPDMEQYSQVMVKKQQWSKFKKCQLATFYENQDDSVVEYFVYNDNSAYTGLQIRFLIKSAGLPTQEGKRYTFKKLTTKIISK